MTTFKITKERKLEIQAERLWRLALDIALQTTNAHNISHKGLSIVADETRNLANKLYCFLENGASEEEMRVALKDVLIQAEFLSLNGWLEMLHVYTDFSTSGGKSNPIAVILMEIRNIITELCGLLNMEKRTAFLPEPEIVNPSSISNTKVFLLSATINGTQFVESTDYVNEVMAYFPNEQKDSKTFNVRGKKIPIINCYEKFSLPVPKPIDDCGLSCVLIINTKWKSEPEKYAVVVDALPVAVGFYSRIPEGGNVPSKSDVFKNNHIRACWDTADGGQMLFLNWEALNS